MIPIVKNIHEIKIQGRVTLAQSLSNFLLNKPANAKDQTIDNPTYPRYKNGGWNANPGSWRRGFKPTPSIGAGSSIRKGFDPKNKVKIQSK